MNVEAPNIILITIDSLRYDHLGCYGYPRNTSPNIDALATRGVKFLQAISNGGHTPAAFPSILVSALPTLNRAEGRAILQHNITLAETLRNSDYQTAAFHSNPQVSGFYGYSKGFEMFDDGLRQFGPNELRFKIRTMMGRHDSLAAKAMHKASRLLRPLLSRAWGRAIISAEEITSKAMTWLETYKEKYFLWLHYMDVHHPYMPPAKYLSQFYDQPVSRGHMKALWQKTVTKPSKLSPSEVQLLITLYDADIKYTDEFIGLLLDKLGNYLADTIVIVTADHGDEFGEHGRFGHRSVYDALLRVPLIMAGPGIKGGTLVKHQVSLIDLPPTIMDFIGITSPKSFRGQSLLPLIRGGAKTKEYTISTQFNPNSEGIQISYRSPGWKYIRTESLDGSGLVLKEEVYNLTNDPGETKNLLSIDTEEVKNFEEEALDKLSQFKQLKVEEATNYEKQKIKAKLSKIRKP